MRIRLGLTAAAALLALIAPAGASGATEIGDNCQADVPTGDRSTRFELSAPANPLPLAAPGNGVITQWKVTVAPEAEVTIPVELQVLRLDTAVRNALVVGQAAGSVAAGQNTFSARIPVQAGDRIGLLGTGEPFGTIACEGADELVVGAVEGASSSSPAPYAEFATIAGVPVSALVEPDADGDGYGDETQDRCPQSATTQDICPVVVIDSYPLAKRRSIVVLVAVSEGARVTVGGTVKLPKRGRAKLKEVTRVLTAGRISAVKLKLPRSLRKELRGLPRGRKLTANLTAAAANVVGAPSTDAAKLKLSGRGKRSLSAPRRR
jgi:hypothetical protein